MFAFKDRAIKSVGFLGFGKSNSDLFNYLKRNASGIDYTLRQSTPPPTDTEGFSRIFTGDGWLDGITEDVLFASPSVRRDDKRLIAAEKRGVLISSDTELFLELTRGDVFAVSGSDGKSTTAYLTALMLEGAYRGAIPCGNFGEPTSRHINDGIGYAYALELSSFTLNYLAPKSKRAVLTNISENHLNWHTSFEEYIAAKRNVLLNAEERVFCYDCPKAREVAMEFPVYAVFSAEQGESELRRRVRAEVYVTIDNGRILLNGESIAAIGNMKARGRHNILNAMAAIAMASGIADTAHLRGITESFRGLSHRCELVGSFRGVRYYDSSIDTSPKRCISTLESFDSRVILILGGRSKGQDYRELLPAIKRHVKHVVLTGEVAEELMEILKSDKGLNEMKIKYALVDDFFEAVMYAATVAREGDSVLLSPAATSYDRFKNFEERGSFFKLCVNAFAKERN